MDAKETIVELTVENKPSWYQTLVDENGRAVTLWSTSEEYQIDDMIETGKQVKSVMEKDGGGSVNPARLPIVCEEYTTPLFYGLNDADGRTAVIAHGPIAEREASALGLEVDKERPLIINPDWYLVNYTDDWNADITGVYALMRNTAYKQAGIEVESANDNPIQSLTDIMSLLGGVAGFGDEMAGFGDESQDLPF